MTDTEIRKGLAGVVADVTAISKVNPDTNSLLYRGYPIQELAKHGDMMDCWHLLLRGTLPTRAQRRVFQREARGHRMVHEHLIRFFNGFQHDAHPKSNQLNLGGRPSVDEKTMVKSGLSQRAGLGAKSFVQQGLWRAGETCVVPAPGDPLAPAPATPVSPAPGWKCAACASAADARIASSCACA